MKGILIAYPIIIAKIKKAARHKVKRQKRGKNENEMTTSSHVNHDYYSIPPFTILYSYIKLQFDYIFVTLFTNSITSSVVLF